MTTWNLEETQCHLLICNGSTCMRKGAEEVTQAIRNEITALNADHKIHTTRTQCNGRCMDACVVIAYPEGVWYKDMTPDLGRDLVNKHLNKGRLEDQVVYHFDERFISTDRSISGVEKNPGSQS